MHTIRMYLLPYCIVSAYWPDERSHSYATFANSNANARNARCIDQLARKFQRPLPKVAENVDSTQRQETYQRFRHAAAAHDASEGAAEHAKTTHSGIPGELAENIRTVGARTGNRIAKKCLSPQRRICHERKSTTRDARPQNKVART